MLDQISLIDMMTSILLCFML